MDKNEIMNILPHRNSMLLLDEVEKRDEKAFGSLKINGNEWFLDGHFPENPMVPGVILCEIMAQSVCVLVEEYNMGKSGAIPVFAGMKNVKFLKTVKPGDVFKTECRIIRHKYPYFFAEGKGYVDEEVCVKGEFSFKIIEG